MVMPRILLAGKPIVITGASSGIGAATAVACAKAGMPVALAARRADKLEAVADTIRSAGGRAVAIACDVTDPQACIDLIDRAEQELGPIHSVFANAGYGEKVNLLEVPDDRLREIFETNFFGTINTIRPAAERMIERQAGHILICSSCLAVFPMPGYSAYCATKAAQHHIGRALDVELADLGIFTSTVHPVGTRTELFDVMAQRTGSQPGSDKSNALMQHPDRVAKAIVRCLRRPKPEVWTSFPARHGMLLAAHTPRLTTFLLKRFAKPAPAQARASSTTA